MPAPRHTFDGDTVRALFAALQAAWSDVHPTCDQILQCDSDAVHKGESGPAGARHCARHVATYTAGQTIAAYAITRALGYRLPLSAYAAGAAINAGTHYVIDRRRHLVRLINKIGKGGYLDHATVQRREGVVDTAGPGAALMEMDQAAHRLCGVIASLVTTGLAVRHGRRR